jgi:hypothetical protein
MANYSAESPSLAGLIPTFRTAAGGGDSFDNNGKQIVEFVNGSGAPITVTFDAPNPDNFQIIDNSHDVAVAIAAGGRRIFGPFPINRFNDVNGRVQMTYSGVTSLTFAVINALQGN